MILLQWDKQLCHWDASNTGFKTLCTYPMLTTHWAHPCSYWRPCVPQQTKWGKKLSWATCQSCRACLGCWHTSGQSISPCPWAPCSRAAQSRDSPALPRQQWGIRAPHSPTQCWVKHGIHHPAKLWMQFYHRASGFLDRFNCKSASLAQENVCQTRWTLTCIIF